jgi:two-component system sensor histidine kinase CiaH
MEHLLKPFVVWGIDFRHNIFLAARLKLTVLYVLIVTIIVGGFSIFLFISVIHNLQDTGDDDFANGNARIHFIDRTVEPIRNTIVLILAAAGLSYWLAGVTLRPVQRSLEAQRLFAAQASHELRTPLTVIQSEAEVILRNQSAPASELRATLYSTLEETHAMTILIDDLLALARSENAPLQNRTTVSVEELLKKVTEKLMPLAKIKNLKLSYSSSSNMHILGTSQTLERLLTNLIDNSIEHTSKGGISISATAIDTNVLLKIVDTGIGIPSAQLPHIFERFYKGNAAKAGSGLGLSIIKEIVAQYGGSVYVESEISIGTTVFVTLPLA